MHSPMAVSPVGASPCEQEHEHDSSIVAHSAEPSSTSCRELARQGSSVSSRKSAGEQEQALSPGPPEPSDGVTRIASTLQAATQDMLVNLIKEPGAAAQEVSELFVFPVYPMSGTPAAQQENLQLTQQQHEIMAALSGCSDVMTMLRRVKPKAYLAIHELYGIDRLSFSVWFKLLRASQRRPNGFRSAAAQSPEAATGKAAAAAPASHRGADRQAAWQQPQPSELDRQAVGPALGRPHNMGDSAQTSMGLSADGRALSNQRSLDQSLVSSVTSWELASGAGGHSPTPGRLPSSRASHTSPFASGPAVARGHSYQFYPAYAHGVPLFDKGQGNAQQSWEVASAVYGRPDQCDAPRIQEQQEQLQQQQYHHQSVMFSGSMNMSCPCSPALSARRASHPHLHPHTVSPAHHASYDPSAWEHGDPVSPPSSPKGTLWNSPHVRPPNGAQSPALPTMSSEPLPHASPASRQQRLQAHPTTPARKRALELSQEHASESGGPSTSRRAPVLVPPSAFATAAADQQFWQRQVQMQQMQVQRQQIQRQQDQQLAAMLSKPRPSYWQAHSPMQWQQEWLPSSPQPHRFGVSGHGGERDRELALAGLYRQGQGAPQPGTANHRSASGRRGDSYRGGMHPEPTQPPHHGHLPTSFHPYGSSAGPPCSPHLYTRAPCEGGKATEHVRHLETELCAGDAGEPPSPSEPHLLQPQQAPETQDLEFLNWFLEQADTA